jgi:hypothetical protein
MSTSTTAFVPGLVRFVSIVLLQSMCLWLPAVGSLAGETPMPRYRFLPVFHELCVDGSTND